MATGAADGIFRSLLYEGCISDCDINIERRPYHRNCRCALHDKSLGRNCSRSFPKSKNVSYPMRRSWSEGCLAMVAASGYSSPSSSPSLAGVHGAGKQQLESYKEEEEDK
ncbi:hypothetical protein E1A91_A06G053500v1 [Gossypium mustelinum]|uniref:Uncharacterized protein n=1 Tax=Gossypium mustelinum TaxID=34275 RepID=A0A5D2YTI6_GOSMU|nr:hypothetical protein E1A91_A06G053500v1 [Gossypium mustelinum]